MQKITPCLWFDHEAEEAANFYVSVFKDSVVESVVRYENAGPNGDSRVTTVVFRIEDQRFYALNGGPLFKFTPAISFFVDCADQAEVDHLWEKLSDGGEEQPCGWLLDRYGVSWQIIPKVLMELLQDEDPVRAERVMTAMLKMKKIDIAALRQAHAGN